jgi:hypothetical protein
MRRSGVSSLLFLLLSAGGPSMIPLVRGGTADHRYKSGEHVELWVNKVRRQAAKTRTLLFIRRLDARRSFARCCCQGLRRRRG